MRYRPGEALPDLVKAPVTREQLVRYAGASGDFNPIHYDDGAARGRGLEGVIAHGMLSMAFLGQLVEAALGAGCVRRIEVHFRGMVKLGDVITCRGEVTEVRSVDGRPLAVCAVEAVNEDAEAVTNGTVEAWMD